VVQPFACSLGGTETVGAKQDVLQLLVQVGVESGASAQRAILSISENKSFDNAQLNFVSDFMTLLAAKVASMLQNHAWGESA
jgi:hypothetical protein